jgi:hypothetical protein
MKFLQFTPRITEVDGIEVNVKASDFSMLGKTYKIRVVPPTGYGMIGDEYLTLHDASDLDGYNIAAGFQDFGKTIFSDDESDNTFIDKDPVIAAAQLLMARK